MTTPLMPKATAVWLVDNTTLTFDQIAEFCDMHPLEVQGIADGTVAGSVIGQSPIQAGLISQKQLDAAQEDPDFRLKISDEYERFISSQKKGKKSYTPIARRQDKPDAIAWIVKNHPEISDAQIGKLVGTTKNTINAVRGRTHWNIQNIRPRDPVLLGLCTQTALYAAIEKAKPAKKEQAEEKQEATAS